MYFDVYCRIRLALKIFRINQSNGFLEHPGYGQFIPKNYFPAFVHVYSFLWADEKCYLYDNKVHWEMLIPFVKAHNKKKLELLKVAWYLLNESMSLEKLQRQKLVIHLQ